MPEVHPDHMEQLVDEEDSEDVKELAVRPRLYYKRNGTPFTQERKAVALHVYAETGRVAQAAKTAQVSVSTVQAHKNPNHPQYDPEFAEAWEAAGRVYDDSLRAEAYRRGVEGVEEPVIGGKDRNEVVTYVKRYSDRLLLAEMKARMPAEYGEKISVDKTVKNEGGSGPFGNVDLSKLNRQQRAKLRDFLSSLEPETLEAQPVVDAEYEQVEYGSDDSDDVNPFDL